MSDGCVVERDGAGRIVSSKMVTISGLMVDPLNLRPEDVRIDDIAHHLSMLCRFCGAVREFYSVAEHSVLVCREVELRAYRRGGDLREFRYLLMLALLHDACEAYLGDTIRPRKVCYPSMNADELVVQESILRSLGLWAPVPAEWHLLIKRADDAVCRAEAEILVQGGGRDWGWGDTQPSQYMPMPLSQKAARGKFCETFERLYPDAQEWAASRQSARQCPAAASA